MNTLSDENKQKLIESACSTLDEIMDIVNGLGVYGDTSDKKSCYIAHTSKQDVYFAVLRIKALVNRVNTIESESTENS